MHTQESMIESEAEARNDCRNQTLSYIDRVVSQVNLLLALDSLFEVAKTTESREYNDVCLCCHSHMRVTLGSESDILGNILGKRRSSRLDSTFEICLKKTKKSSL